MENKRAPSLWLDRLPERPIPRPRLEGDDDCDVAIVGAGFTGLWTAYYLMRAQPESRVTVVEREMAGYGAAGRSAGWVSGGIAGSWSALVERGGAAAARRALVETYDAIDRIGEVVDREEIDCHFRKGGALTIATTRPQARRLEAEVAAMRERGLGQGYLPRLGRGGDHGVGIGVDIELSAITSLCARTDPGRLARGLAETCERGGVHIYERTEAVDLRPKSVRCETGTIRAEYVLQATEAYSLLLPGERRRFMPLVSAMAATEPLPTSVWEELNWEHGLGIADRHRLHFYAQRTGDDRLAMGRRGKPYRLRTPLAEDLDHHASVKERIGATMRRYFPAVGDAPLEHFWIGPLALPRDERMSIWYDRGNGLGWAGGYGGHGIVASNIAGRTLVDLVLGRDSDLVALPWVGTAPGRWPREPFRHLSAQMAHRRQQLADDREDRQLGET